MENEDYRIIKLCLRGKKEEFAKLVDKYHRKVYNLAYRLVGDPEKAKDIAQEAFIKVYKALASYDPRYKFSSWLLKTVSNLCIDYHRTKPASTASLEAVLASGGEASLLGGRRRSVAYEHVEERLELKELQSYIEEGIKLLRPEYRMVLVLRHIENLSYKEIAEMMNLPIGTIKARLFRARRMLKEYLKSRLGDLE